MTDPRPLLWIDATRAAAGFSLWGMTLVERLLREGARRGLHQAIVVVDAQSRQQTTRLRGDLSRLFDIDVRIVESAEEQQVRLHLDEHDTPSLLYFDGDVVHDDRVIDHLLSSGPGHAVAGAQACAAHLATATLQSLPPGAAVTGLADVRATELESLGHYVPELRLTMVPFLVRIGDCDDLRRVDRLLYHRTFKGVIDVVARYGYYHFVRFTTRWLSRMEVSPNLLTLLSILGIWAAIPCFATGQIGWGILSAWVGVILDSMDGKLARLTVNLSDAMGALEHAAAMPGLGLWFVALGWFLADGELLSSTPASISCWLLVSAFLADKVVSGTFKKVYGYELFDARPLDAAFHLIAARRNIHLLLLTVGAISDSIATAFECMAAGMVASFLFHLARFGWITITGPHQVKADG